MVSGKTWLQHLIAIETDLIVGLWTGQAELIVGDGATAAASGRWE